MKTKTFKVKITITPDNDLIPDTRGERSVFFKVRANKPDDIKKNPRGFYQKGMFELRRRGLLLSRINPDFDIKAIKAEFEKLSDNSPNFRDKIEVISIEKQKPLNKKKLKNATPIVFRVSEDEREEIENKALDFSDGDISKWARLAALNYKPGK